ncbi:flagellar FliJ protein [Okibacterium sp. HSC-33S16]|uniref:flagellar FliJ family protein n=1 Tax=Okibacterium sp. HSC-33S16 TaxID=2910965 RepID=UPI00209DFE0B|nr:flagellar FliJ family protein [Okibacterium sp. HSC-33S16]MCP2032929.1 flagellar FliJ protein [Okibacterium sp. HSC-33S16]
MTRSFSLAGLLRLRRLREDQAAGNLAAANAEVHDAAMRTAHARDLLADTPAEVKNTAALNAINTARTASRSMLAELNALSALKQAAADESAAAFAAARSESVRIEKLETRHSDLLAQEDLRAEQLVLDEIASRSWHSAQNEVTA